MKKLEKREEAANSSETKTSIEMMITDEWISLLNGSKIIKDTKSVVLKKNEKYKTELKKLFEIMKFLIFVMLLRMLAIILKTIHTNM